MQLDYEIVYANRKTITITVESDRSVVVHTPVGISAEKIKAVVASKRL